MFAKAELNYLAALAFLLLHLTRLSIAHSVQDKQQLHLPPAQVTNPQLIINEPTEYIVSVGSNLTLSCSAHGTQPLVFVWFQDQKNGTSATTTTTPTAATAAVTTTTTTTTTTAAPTNDQSDSPPSTELLEERRYEIQEDINENNITTSTLFLINLKPTDTSIFLCWVENAAGHAIRNFSLVVTDQAPVSQVYYTNGLHLVTLIVIVSLLIGTIVCWIVVRYTNKLNSNDKVRKQQQQQLQQQHHNHHHHHLHHQHQHQQQLHKANHQANIDSGRLDGLIEQMRSGIISLDHQSMSPVKEFNARNQLQSSRHTSPTQQKQRNELTLEEMDDYGFLHPNGEHYHNYDYSPYGGSMQEADQFDYPTKPQPSNMCITNYNLINYEQQQPLSQHQQHWQQQQQHQHHQQQDHQWHQPLEHQQWPLPTQQQTHWQAQQFHQQILPPSSTHQNILAAPNKQMLVANHSLQVSMQNVNQVL